MEIRLDAIEEEQPAARDLFLAVRVGDVQKQSRFSKTRTYKFPESGSGNRFGRLEVYRRVGALTVSFDNVAGDGQDVDVPCDVPGIQKLGLRMAVKGGSAAKPNALPPVESGSRASKRMDAAQRYMADHRLEEILADSMREVLSRKPADPLAFLSDLLLKKRGPAEDSLPPAVQEKPPALPARDKPQAGQKLPPLGAAPQDKAAPPPPPPLVAGKKQVEGFKGYYTSHVVVGLGPDGLNGIYQRFKAFSSIPAAAPIAVAPKPTVPAAGSKAYYSNYVVVGLGSDGLAGTYDKFKAFSAAPTPEPISAPKPPATGSKDYYSNYVVVGLGADGLAGIYSKFKAFSSAAKPKPAVAPKPLAAGSTAYYTTHVVVGLGYDGLAGLYSKFKAFSSAPKPKPPIAGLDNLYGKFDTSSAPKPKSQIMEGGGFTTYYQGNILPGSCVDKNAMEALLKKFPGAASAAAKPAKQAAEPVVAKPPFMYQASVGSWLARTPAQATPSWCFMEPKQENKSEPKPEPKPDQKVQEAAGSSFRLKPSVGTWLARKPLKFVAEGSSAAPAAAPAPAPAPAAEAKQFGRRPSVGTWLAPKPAQVPQEACPVRRDLLRTHRQDSLLRMDPVELYESFKAELDAKDAEIEDLKRQLATRG